MQHLLLGWLLWIFWKEQGDELKAFIHRGDGRESVLTCGQEYSPTQAIPENS